MSKTKRIEALIEQAKREQEEPMAKKIHRIEVLEQRVAELMGQVEKLQAKIAQLEATRHGRWSIEPYPGPPYIATSETVVGQSEDEARALNENRWELYGEIAHVRQTPS